ncbi:MAG TPA: metal-sulfur cluster assembly factor [bacterium]|nr:metal-sulfur cluster assembly factor [bacterium]
MPVSLGSADPQERRGAAGPQAVTPDAVLAALAEVVDPEWPVSIVDMGLVYGVAVDGGTVSLTLTFTATACPCMEMIQEDIRERLHRLPGVRDVRIVVSWDPPWTKDRLTDVARRELARCGVAV